MATTDLHAGAWIPDDSTFGARLALIRQGHAWNIATAAAECDIDAESWRGWETKGRNPRNLYEVCDKIASASGADYHWLLGGPRTGSNRNGLVALVNDGPLDPPAPGWSAPTLGVA